MKPYYVRALAEILQGASFAPDVKFGVYEKNDGGAIAIALCYEQRVAERIAKLLNEEQR